MVTRQSVESVLARVRPYLVADGGDIELIDIRGNSAVVKLSGMCAHCPSAHMTLHIGIEAALRQAIPDFESLRTD
jgi:Fe-S cluster biogenesis protein NfuA